MSGFSFNFSGEDIEEYDVDSDEWIGQVEKIKISPTITTLPPKSHSLSDLVSDYCPRRKGPQPSPFSLTRRRATDRTEKLSEVPSQISYNNLVIPHTISSKQSPQDVSALTSGDTIVQRRSIFDIRAQLMAEADPEVNDNENLLAGLEHGDLTTGVYEGGFKTWECAIDLARRVSDVDLSQDWHIIELGAGTAVPSLNILQRALSCSKVQGTAVSHLHFTLCDYNEDVLRLVTGPNVLLNSLVHQQNMTDKAGQKKEEGGELDLEDFDEQSIQEVSQELKSRGISFDFVSGGWGHSFLDHISPLLPAKTADQNPHNIALPKYQTLILASETIYSPESTKVFAETLISILKRDKQKSKAWVAAKRIYFGVGGGIEDFSKEIKMQQGDVKLLEETSTSGVGRVVLEITVE